MNDKEIWEHLNKEVAKLNTLVRTSQKIASSVLYKSSRYNLFAITILDAFTRVVSLSLYYLFDEKYSWSLYSISDLTGIEKIKVEALEKQTEKYIKFRHQEIGHSSKQVAVDKHNRFQWFSKSELENLSSLISSISELLHFFSQNRNFRETYAHEWGGVNLSLQRLVEDLTTTGK